MQFAATLVIIFSLTLAGGMIPLLLVKINRFLSIAVFFAAGLLLGAGLFHLLPESIEILGVSTGFPILIGFAIFYIPQKFMLTHPCDEDDCKFHKIGMLAFVGIAFHAMIDGVGVGAGAGAESLGYIVSAVVSHKIPAAIALSLILLKAGFSRKKTAVYLILFSLATPIGAFFTLTYLESADKFWLGNALAFSAGNFVAIAGSDLLRRLHDEKPEEGIPRLISLIIGCMVPLI